MLNVVCLACLLGGVCDGRARSSRSSGDKDANVANCCGAAAQQRDAQRVRLGDAAKAATAVCVSRNINVCLSARSKSSLLASAHTLSTSPPSQGPNDAIVSTAIPGAMFFGGVGLIAYSIKSLMFGSSEA